MFGSNTRHCPCSREPFHVKTALHGGVPMRGTRDGPRPVERAGAGGSSTVSFAVTHSNSSVASWVTMACGSPGTVPKSTSTPTALSCSAVALPHDGRMKSSAAPWRMNTGGGDALLLAMLNSSEPSQAKLESANTAPRRLWYCESRLGARSRRPC